nr:unnamed protein product [Digitaria exilis]
MTRNHPVPTHFSGSDTASPSSPRGRYRTLAGRSLRPPLGESATSADEHILGKNDGDDPLPPPTFVVVFLFCFLPLLLRGLPLLAATLLLLFLP